ncbi:MAG: FliJ family protein [Alphaproteobacteria bacterium]|nr:FliJ family protein [Alphaproteobacteria bacterium]
MSEKKKDLHGVIRLQKWEVDEKRRALGQLLGQEQMLLKAINALEEERIREAKAAEEEPSAAFLYGAYIDGYLKRKKTFEQALADLQRQIVVARDAVAEAFTELKSYEITQERRDDEEKKELDRKEQLAMDERSMVLHRRKQKIISDAEIEAEKK